MSHSLSVEVVVAVDESNGIGREGQLPWHLTGDLRRFRELTTSRGRPCTTAAGRAPTGELARAADAPAVLMGRRTYQSLPPTSRPLPGRLNVVLTRDPAFDLPTAVVRATTLLQALDQLTRLHARRLVGRVFAIGGAQVFAQVLALVECRCVHLTRVEHRFDCDAHLPPLEPGFRRSWRSAPQREGALRYRFELFERRPVPPTPA
jgi:dihydrofolate reductase/thymidylate synthase